MVEFKVVISDPKGGKSHQTTVKGHHANSLIGKKIGEEIDGIFVGLPGYKLLILGGTDRDGFPMRRDLPGTGKRKLLLSYNVGYKPLEKGKREKKCIRGNTIALETVQINTKIISYGPKPLETLISLEKGEGNK